MTLTALRKDVCEASQNLEKKGFFLAGMGCVSGIDRGQGRIVVKPVGVPGDRLMPDDMLVLDLAGKALEGSLEPSPEVAAHAHLYREFPEVGGVVSLYSPHATMFAQAQRPIPCLGMVHARFFKGEIPVTRALRKPEIERSYGKGVAAVIVERFSRMDALEIPGVLVAHHGAFAWGRSVADAVLNSEVLERAAQLAFGTRLLAPQSEPLPSMFLDKHFLEAKD